MNNLLDMTLDLIVKVNTHGDKDGIMKKRAVMTALRKQFASTDNWDLVEDLISALIDFLVSVGKQKKQFKLIKSHILSCCR